MTPRPALRRPRTWLLVVPALVLLVAVGGPFLYINVLRDEAPPPLGFDDTTATTAAGQEQAQEGSSTPVSVDGRWTVGEGSQAGYRVAEVLFGQDTEAVARTSAVAGEVQVDGATVTAASFTVDLTTIESDEDRRDNQFRGRIMAVATHPTATFTLKDPIPVNLSADGTPTTVTATGDFTIRGTTRTETFPLSARRVGEGFQVSGSIPIEFTRYGIPDPSFGPARVQGTGQIEFLLALRQA